MALMPTESPSSQRNREDRWANEVLSAGNMLDMAELGPPMALTIQSQNCVEVLGQWNAVRLKERAVALAENIPGLHLSWLHPPKLP